MELVEVGTLYIDRLLMDSEINLLPAGMDRHGINFIVIND